MDAVSQWSMKLAEAAVPDEVDLAPAIAAAYLEGGEARSSLFKKGDTSVTGAFGPGNLVAVLPWILKGIAAAAKGLSTLLASNELGNILAVVKGAIEIGEKVNPKNEDPPLPETAPYTTLKRVLDVMGTELRKAGLQDDQADLITFRVLNSLLEDPPSATEFVQQLEATS